MFAWIWFLNLLACDSHQFCSPSCCKRSCWTLWTSSSSLEENTLRVTTSCFVPKVIVIFRNVEFTQLYFTASHNPSWPLSQRSKCRFLRTTVKCATTVWTRKQNYLSKMNIWNDVKGLHMSTKHCVDLWFTLRWEQHLSELFDSSVFTLLVKRAKTNLDL